MSSKAEKVREFMTRIVEDSLNEAIANNPDHADSIRRMKSHIIHLACWRAVRTYSLMELNDIMHWKKPKSV